MNVWNFFLIRLLDTTETTTGSAHSFQTALSECKRFFPGFRITFWSINTRKNEIKIFKLRKDQLSTTELPLSQFKFEQLLRSQSKPFYAFENSKTTRVLIPLFVEGQISGCLSVSANKSVSSRAWKARIPYFLLVAKRLIKALQMNVKNNAIETLMELNQDLEVKMNEKSISLEQEKMAHIQAGKMATLGEVAVGIAHEINNPLTIIMSRVGNLEKIMTKKNMLLPEFSDSIYKINQTVERIVKIINGLRHFSHSGSDKKMPVILSKVINDSLELCQERLKKNDIELKVVSSGYDVEISAFDTQMIQVLLNLIINSLDAVKDLSEKWIEIEYKIEEDHLNLIVRDSGRGLAPEVAEKIMNPFYTTKERGQGTGLGLSLSKSIVENHEGKLFYNSDSKNTEFVITLPYMRLLSNEADM